MEKIMVKLQVLIGGWCNGSTLHSGCSNWGSNPCPPATKTTVDPIRVYGCFCLDRDENAGLNKVREACRIAKEL